MAKLLEITGKAISGEWGQDDDTGTGIPVLRTTNFTNEGFVNYKNVVTRSILKKNIAEKYLRHGDVRLCNGCSRLLCEQGSVKFLFLIACSIAVRYEIKEQKQVFEAKFRLFPSDAAASVGGIIAALANKIHPPPQIIVYNVMKFFCAH